VLRAGQRSQRSGDSAFRGDPETTVELSLPLSGRPPPWRRAPRRRPPHELVHPTMRPSPDRKRTHAPPGRCRWAIPLWCSACSGSVWEQPSRLFPPLADEVKENCIDIHCCAGTGARPRRPRLADASTVAFVREARCLLREARCCPAPIQRRSKEDACRKWASCAAADLAFRETCASRGYGELAREDLGGETQAADSVAP